jgi:hypothetical protein
VLLLLLLLLMMPVINLPTISWQLHLLPPSFTTVRGGVSTTSSSSSTAAITIQITVILLLLVGAIAAAAAHLLCQDPSIQLLEPSQGVPRTAAATALWPQQQLVKQLTVHKQQHLQHPGGSQQPASTTSDTLQLLQMHRRETGTLSYQHATI